MSATSAAPLLALLRESDDAIRSYALESINGIVDQEWPEVSNDLPDIEALYDDLSFSNRKMAALVASKVYYNLGEYDSAVKYALAAEDYFNMSEKTQYVETIVSKSIEMYIKLSTQKYESKETKKDINTKLTSIFEKMLDNCVINGEYRLALGIALEGFRLDIVEKILKDRSKNDTESNTCKLINYVLTASSTTVSNSSFRINILKSLFDIILLSKSIDYFTLLKVVVNLNDPDYAVRLFEKLQTDENTNNSNALSYQIAFDIVASASQGLLTELVNRLTEQNFPTQLLTILSGVPACDMQTTFLLNNKNIDIELLNKTKSALDGKISLFHTAVSVANGFMHAGTADNSFIKNNLPWLGKAQNWAKFTATASLGVINKGNLIDGKKVMNPYLPGSRASSRYIKGGSLYSLGLIYAGYGSDIVDYLMSNIVENSSKTSDPDIDVLLHGASLGLGLAALGTNDSEVNEALSEVLYNDSAVSGEAAALGIGLTMLGSGDEDTINSMFFYAHETKHGNITRGLAMGIALVSYGKQEMADDIINKMLDSENTLLRYGGAFTLAMAYVGTSNNKAIKKLLHIAVSDSNDDVRRAAVTSLGFILLRDYATVPRIVELLSKSHNPHVRCGTAFALGTACAGKALDTAVEVLESLTKDPVDFVRQAAMIALSLIMIQQTDKLNPKVNELNELFLNVITNKHQEGLAKFGACIAQGIINAGGRNVTIQLDNPETNTLDTKSIVGLVMFSQFWYWFPLAHFLSLSFTPTSVIAVNSKDLSIPKFELNCFSRPDVFDYPKMYEEKSSKEVAKVATAVLSTTARAKARAKRMKKEKGEDNEDIQENAEDKTEKDNEEETKSKEGFVKNRYSATPYQIENMKRVLPQQARYISFIKESRFTPVRKNKNISGIIVLHDTKPNEPVEVIKTIRQVKDVNAPVPKPFKIEDDLDFDRL
ncbi:proteasome regulatory particle base subunit RPN2 PWA37_001435 [Arxiozyma heterogenica]|uniref:proteasome regulatory particle base subunit RPN2 n=1 Tax=Arxiozyma heterogenica TaxID=278026 RepID=UPI002F03C458